MNVLRLTVLGGALVSTFLFGLTGCKHGSASETRVINGERIESPSDYGAVGFLDEAKCTVTKIGSYHFVTAAHCVSAVQIPAMPWHPFTPGKTVHISWDRTFYDTEDRAVGQPFTVEMTYLHPGAYLPGSRGPDIAVIQVVEESPDVPMASLNFEFVDPNTEVEFLGYGCFQSYDGDGTVIQDLRKGSSKVIPLATVPDKPGVFVAVETEVDRALAEQAVFITAGTPMDESFSSVCPGDFGGPVFRKGQWDQGIVGINSFGMVEDVEEPRLPLAGGHARLHQDKRYGVQTWLEAVLAGDFNNWRRTDSYFAETQEELLPGKNELVLKSWPSELVEFAIEMKLADGSDCPAEVSYVDARIVFPEDDPIAYEVVQASPLNYRLKPGLKRINHIYLEAENSSESVVACDVVIRRK